MNAVVNPLPPTIAEVREDFVPKEHYVSDLMGRLERERLWPRVWQVACREEELHRPGSYILYDIGDQSIIVLRSESGISAFHNVCPHRGNKLLTKPRGNLVSFRCGFHGWKWDLEGNNTYIKDQDDWRQCGGLSSDAVGLGKVLVGRWGGFVFVNLSDDAEPFLDFIQPVPAFLDCLDFDKMRFAWYKTMPLKGNWKVAMESFMESYHVFTTHFQTNDWLDEPSTSSGHGKHGNHGYPERRPFGAPSHRTGKPIPSDMRAAFLLGMEKMIEQTGGKSGVGMGTQRSVDACRRLLTELPADTAAADVEITAGRFMMEAADAAGVGWPTVSAEQAQQLGVDWNIFPNIVLVFAFDATLVFRARPNGDDVGSCIFDMWALARARADEPPAFEYEYYENWRDHVHDIPPLLVQDLVNIEQIQKGMQSVAFAGSRLNPVQERQISNHHRVLRDYIDS